MISRGETRIALDPRYEDAILSGYLEALRLERRATCAEDVRPMWDDAEGEGATINDFCEVWHAVSI